MTAGRPPRVLVDATSVPADRGGVGRYVDGLLGALGKVCGSEVDLAVVCQRTDRSATPGCCPAREVDPRPGRGRAPAGPAGLGADRPAAARPAGRRPGAALAVLHLPAAGRLPGDGDRARRDVLHRAGALRQVPPHVLPQRDQDLAAPRRPGDRAEQGHPGRADPAARRRPDPDRRGLPRRRPGRLPRAQRRRRRPAYGPGSGSATAATSRSSAPRSRARTCPT